MSWRIVHIIPTLDRAGAEKQLALLVAGLPRDAFEVHVCVLTRSGPMEADLRQAGVPLHVLQKRWKLDPRAWARLCRFLRRLRPDLVHTWLFAANAYGRAAAVVCGVPHVIASERCVDLWKQWPALAIDRFLARHTDCIVANSPAVREFYLRHGIAPQKLVVIPNGIRPPEPCSTSRAAILAELGLPQNARLVGLVGRLWPQKRVEDAIWAADLLKRVRDDTHLLILGDGPQRHQLRRFRDRVEIADRVHFLGHRDDVAGLMPHFDVLWNTSAYEGQSNAVLEAMAWGIPVVASDIPGNRDLVVPGQTGYLVAAGQQGRADLAAYTQRLLDDPDLARRLGQAGRHRALEHFSADHMIQQYVDLYHRILTGARFALPNPNAACDTSTA